MDDDDRELWENLPPPEDEQLLGQLKHLDQFKATHAFIDYLADWIANAGGERPTEAEAAELTHIAKAYHSTAVKAAVGRLAIRRHWPSPEQFRDLVEQEKAKLPNRRRDLIRTMADAAKRTPTGAEIEGMWEEAKAFDEEVIRVVIEEFIAERSFPGSRVSFGKKLQKADQALQKPRSDKAGGQKQQKYQEWPPGWRPSSERPYHNNPGERRLLSRMVDQGMQDFIEYLNHGNKDVWQRLVRLNTQCLNRRPAYVIPDDRFRQCILHLCFDAGDPGFGLPKERQPPPPDDPEWDYKGYLERVEKAERGKEHERLSGVPNSPPPPTSGEPPTAEQRELYKNVGVQHSPVQSMSAAIRGKLPPWQTVQVENAMHGVAVLHRVMNADRRRHTPEEIADLNRYLGELVERYPNAEAFARMINEHVLTIPPATAEELRLALEGRTA